MDFIAPYKKVSRVRTKRLNFLKIYRGGKETAAKTLELPREQSDQIIAIYDQTFPEFEQLGKEAEALARNRGWVKTISGRRARFPDQTWCHAAINYVIQGSASDIMKKKLVEVHRAKDVSGFVMRMTVHDAMNGDSLDPELTPRMIADILNVQSFDLRVPIMWKIKIGRSWADC